ncbi:hypothetical protein [Romboutsia sp.]|uniref:hypothetical protein n=1 Tax=Romboutsia sp. TaxID=1965302 RepID=UPI003F2FCE2F
MSNNISLERLFGGCGFGGCGFIIIIIIGALLLLGDEIIEWLFCEEMSLIWIVLLVLLLTNFDDGCGCC